MKPKMISKNKLFITGISGDGRKTGELWNHFDALYHNNPFSKADEKGYEVRFYDGDKPAVRGKDIHVGFNTENDQNYNGYTTLALPATEYAVFDVYVANGYNSGNTDMDKWLADNAAQYRQRMIDGTAYIIECYGEKFNGGCQPDSIVEMCIPVYSACALCGVFMTKPEDYSGNDSYCYHCCEDHTLRQNVTMDVLNADIQKLIDIETAHPNLLSDPLLRYTKNWLALDDTLKSDALPTLYLALIDGQDCDFTGTQWEAEWLADGKICHCLACNAARRCISDIKLIKK
jgi:predicted transcriptional regulator YdeE